MTVHLGEGRWEYNPPALQGRCHVEFSGGAGHTGHLRIRDDTIDERGAQTVAFSLAWRALLSAIRRTILLKAHIQHQRNLLSSLQLLLPSVNKRFAKSPFTSEFTILFPSTSAECLWSPLFRAFTALTAESRSSPIIMTCKILRACPVHLSQREPPRQQ